jgi:hypothetical protein
MVQPLEDVDDDDDNMGVYDNDWILDWNQLNELPDDKEVEDVVDFTAGDVLGKTLALVNQVSFFSFVRFSCLYI